MDALAAQQSATGSAADQQAVAEIRDYARDRVIVYVPQVVTAIEVIYAREFTAPQLRDLITFYRSPTGALLSRKLPQISAEVQTAMLPIVRQTQRDVLMKICDLRSCTAEQRAQIAALAQSTAEH